MTSKSSCAALLGFSVVAVSPGPTGASCRQRTPRTHKYVDQCQRPMMRRLLILLARWHLRRCKWLQEDRLRGLGLGSVIGSHHPVYDGEEPETSFALWERNVRLWEYETDVPRGKRGVKLLRVLSGTARMAVEEMPFEEIACEDGMRNIMSRLREFFQPHLEVSLPRAFEQAVYGQQRQNREGFGEYIARMDRAFNRLKKEGVDLPESAQGYILYRQAALSEAQEQRFLVWSDGRYDRLSAVKALRKLDKVVKEKGKTAYLVDAPENEQVGLFDDAEVDWFEDDGPDAENYVYVQEGDLSEIMDEEDVLSALFFCLLQGDQAGHQGPEEGTWLLWKGRNAKGQGQEWWALAESPHRAVENAQPLLQMRPSRPLEQGVQE